MGWSPGIKLFNIGLPDIIKERGEKEAWDIIRIFGKAGYLGTRYPPEYGGTGLGLSVSYDFVQQHRGIIGVHSRPGLGSHFSVLLPVDQETTLDLQPSILCVDDEETVLSLLRDSFAELKDMSLKITNTPEGVMAYLEEHPEVDIVLSEIAMPGIDGWKLLKKIKRRFPLLYVILYTGHPYASEQKPEDTPDPDYLLRKPFKIKKLFELINKMDRQRL